MKLERKVYTSRDQKVGDFMLGVGLIIALNVAFLAIYLILATLDSVFYTTLNSGNFQDFGTLVTLALSFLPFVLNILVMIYFGLTRYWIALGMLGGFAVALLVVLILGAACFALIAGISSANQ